MKKLVCFVVLLSIQVLVVSSSCFAEENFKNWKEFQDRIGFTPDYSDLNEEEVQMMKNYDLMPHAKRNRAEKPVENALDVWGRVLEKHKDKFKGISSLEDPKAVAILRELAKKDPEVRAALENVQKSVIDFGGQVKNYR